MIAELAVNNSMNNPFPPVDHPTMYRCVGLIEGQYFPSIDAFNRGVLLTNDGDKFPTLLLGKTVKQLQENPDQLGKSHVWSTWVKTLKESPGLLLRLIRIHKTTDVRKQKIIEGINYFNIRGLLIFEEGGQIGLRITRNQKPLEEQELKKWQTFVVVIDGFLPNAVSNQFWELDCRREGERLVLDNGTLICDAPPRQKKKQQGEKSSLAPSAQSVPPQGDVMPVSGKMEITMKISQLPATKTGENGWKQFDIDTDTQLVTVTVKPKMFKKLEEAQQNFPLWVAAITGKMGDRTERGFILLEPNIQVFEKKQKEQAEPNAAASGSK